MALVFVTPTRRLRPDAAASFRRARKAGMPSSRLESAHRSAKTQQKLFDGWTKRLPGFNFALPPEKSNHVKGIAIDAHDGMQSWLIKHGRRYGWRQDANEPWHFDYTPELDQELARIKTREKALKRLAEQKAAQKKLAQIQKILGTTPDGIYGPNTSRAWSDLIGKATQR